MTKLKPCPFCGGESLLRDRYINGVANTKHYIRECRHCKATFANWYRSTKKEPAEQGGLEDVREEMADVQIMLDQMKIIHGDIREVEEAKLARLEDCLNKKEEPK